MVPLSRLAAVLMLPLLLTACLFQPGKFTSTIDINADRSFVFTYLGEIQAIDTNEMAGGLTAVDDGQQQGSTAPKDEKKPGMTEAEKAELAQILSKEAGFRRVEYRGDNIWFVDYRMAGTLTHSFVFPYNLDAEMIFPFVAIETRANGTVRVKAPAFAKSANRPDMSGMGPDMGGGNDRIEGDFTLTTDAEIVSQSNEDGAETGADGRKTIRWKITPQSETPPTAVLRVRP